MCHGDTGGKMNTNSKVHRLLYACVCADIITNSIMLLVVLSSLPAIFSYCTMSLLAVVMVFAHILICLICCACVYCEVDIISWLNNLSQGDRSLICNSKVLIFPLPIGLFLIMLYVISLCTCNELFIKVLGYIVGSLFCFYIFWSGDVLLDSCALMLALWSLLHFATYLCVIIEAHRNAT